MGELRFIAESKKDVVNTPFYVTCTNKFLSGWGVAKGKKAKYIYPCDTMQEARKVQRNLSLRKDNIYINICCRKPFFYGELNTVDVDKESWFRTN